MRRLPMLFGIVMVAVLAGSTSAAAETVAVPPGLTLDDSLLLATEFRTDPSTGEAVYVQMTVSGTITLEEPGLKPKLFDALYCYSGCDSIKQYDGLYLGLDRGADTEYRALENYVKGNTTGNFVATPEYDASHTYTFTFACDENSSITCGKMRAIGVPFGNPAAGQTGSGSLSVTVGDTPPAAACTTITGLATDRESKPIQDATLFLQAAGATVIEGATGTDGRYSIDVPPGTSGELRILLLADATPRFRVMVGNERAGALGPAIDQASGACTQDFAMASLAAGVTAVPAALKDLPAAFDAYQSIAASWTLARRLGSEPARNLPLQVFLYCDRASPPTEVNCPVSPGVPSRLTGERPYIAVDPVWTPNPPADMANMLGHEFGHFFMWSTFGAIPFFPGNANHGGYYVNRSSADSWTEGFASFYSLMVQRLVSRDPEATRAGSAGDMEVNRSAWEAKGRFEEFAIVGVLLDLVDKAGESGTALAERPVAAESVNISDDRDLFLAQVSSDVAVGTPWRAELLDGAGGRLRTIRGTVVEYEGVRLAAAALPVSPQMKSIRLVLRPLAPSGDDDPIAGDVFDLWPAILAFRSTKPEAASAGGHLFDVEELHRAAKLLYGSDSDRDGNAQPDVDEIFIAHGLFGDKNGNQTFDPGETVGLTSHPQHTIDTQTFAAMDTRSTPPVLPELQADIDTPAVAATALVQVEYPSPYEDRSFSELVEPDAQGLIPLPVPPADSDGRVSVIMLAQGYRPAPALEVVPATFWPEADRNAGRSFLSATVAMEAGDMLLADEASTTDEGGGFPILVAVPVVLVALAGAAVAFWYFRRRRATA